MTVLNLRFEGDQAEALEMIEKMRAAGIEVQVSRAIPRQEGVTQVYTIARVTDAAGMSSGQPPTRVKATTGESGLGDSVRALPAGLDLWPRRRPR